jgi:hypothetical protein
MGKSRTVDELAKSVFTIPFNLRPKNDTSGNLYFPLIYCPSHDDGLLGYPHADDLIRDFLKVRPAETRIILERRYLDFLSVLFKEVKATLTTLPSQKTSELLASSWRKHLAGPDARWQLYSSVVHNLKEYHPEPVDPNSEGDDEKKYTNRLSPHDKQGNTNYINLFHWLPFPEPALQPANQSSRFSKLSPPSQVAKNGQVAKALCLRTSSLSYTSMSHMV